MNAIGKYLPKATLLRCWNHVFRSVRYWCHSHNIQTDVLQSFIKDLKELFHKPTIEAYETTLARLSVGWGNKILQYFMKNIHEEVNTSIGRWILEKEGVYIPFCGVVNNQSEGFNTVLKNLQEWKEVLVDCIVLSLHLLQSFYMNEFKRGLTGQGNYHLHERFISLIDLENSANPQYVCIHPADIINRIRSKDERISMTDYNEVSQPTEAEIQPEIFQSPSHFTQLERARIIIQSGRISFDPKLHLFNVLGSDDRPYVVKLFPEEFCSCPFNGLCYHIIAVKISIGNDKNVSPIQKLNLTMFRKRNRNHSDESSGRKRPRKKDADSNPIERTAAKLFWKKLNNVWTIIGT